MINIMNLDSYKAIINYDPVIDKFRGEFVGLNGGADFYATNIEELRKEGNISLKVFLEMCKQEGINPHLKSSLKCANKKVLILTKTILENSI